jgi:hypothetical protein
MKVDYIKKYAPGGAMEAAPPPDAGMEAGAPPPEAAPEGGANGQQDQMMQQLTQVVQSQDPNAALEFCNNLASAAGIQPGGGEAGAEAAAPPPTEEGMPMQRKGGTMKVKMSAADKMRNNK